MDDRRKMFIVSEESVDACFTLNESTCQTATDGKCPKKECSEEYEKAAMKALNSITKADK